MEFMRVEVAVGKTSIYAMTGENDAKIFGRVRYLKIERPFSLSYEQQFCDENENISRHPFALIWPETMLTTVSLTAEGPDQTRIEITWEPAGTFRPEEIDVFTTAKPGMALGWTGSFAKLEDYIARLGKTDSV